MKKLFISSFLVSLFIFSCKPKKDDPTPVINATTIIAPNATSDQFGHLRASYGTDYKRLKGITKSKPNYSTSYYDQQPTASFYTAKKGLVFLDSVYCGKIIARVYNPNSLLNIINSNLTFPLHWKIGSRLGFPAADMKITVKPDTFALADFDFNDSILTTKPYTIKLNKKLIDADKITMSLWQKDSSTFGNILPVQIKFSKEVSKGLDSLTLTPPELAKVHSKIWKEGQILVSCSKDTSVTIGNTNYKFYTERSIKLNVYFK